MKISICLDQLDSHAHMRLFINGGYAGSLIMRASEYEEFVTILENSERVELEEK